MSGAKEEPSKEDQAEPAKPSGGGRKTLPMLVAVLVVLALQAGLAVGVVRFLGIADRAPRKQGHAKVEDSDTDSTAEGDGEGEDEGGKGKKLECLEKPLSKTVTVAGTEAKRYLKASLCLEYDAEKYKDLPKTIEPQMMRVEATVNRILSTATFAMVNDPHVQDSLAKSMGVEINKMLKPEKIQIHAVLVTEWLVQ
jgi:flagellar basal body-associated protein FliL